MANACTADRHGNSYAHTHFGCRCPEARADKARLERERYHRVKSGETKFVDALETHRMIRALLGAGHTLTDIGERLDMSGQAVHRVFGRKKVLRTTEERFRAVYGAMQALPGASYRNVQYGRERGWAVPFAWDPEAIADPDAQPDYGHFSRKQLRAEETLYEYRRIRDSGMSHEYALREMGISHEAWWKACAKVEGPKEKPAQEYTPVRRARNGSLYGMSLDGK